MKPEDLQEATGRKTALLKGMVEYMRDPDHDKPPYEQLDVDALDAILTSFIDTTARLKSPDDAAIMNAVRDCVLKINALADRVEGMIETGQREDLCELLQNFSIAAGLRSVPDDVTEEWRTW